MKNITTYKMMFRTRARAESTAHALRARHSAVRVRKQTLAKPHRFTVKGKPVMTKTVYRIDYGY